MEEYIEYVLKLNKKITIKSKINNWEIIINNNHIEFYEYKGDTLICKKISIEDLINILNDDNNIKIKYSLYYKDIDNNNIIKKINEIRTILNNDNIIIKFKICYN
jgi:hypothetical protein